ncbi:MAG: DUF1820 family protein [Pseudomonadota bacterium]
MSDSPTYRISFMNQGKVYEIYARSVHQSSLFGFIEIEELVFGEKTTVVVDPSEENLKTEFEGVNRIYVPMHSIIRIDEVEKSGQGKITEAGEQSGNVAPFPVFTSNQPPGKT